MNHEQLTEEETREVLARAEAIHSRKADDAPMVSVEAILAAAEEAGLSREAVEQALRERNRSVAAPAKVGDLAFARSVDGREYVAEVLASDDQAVRVRFLDGGEHTLPASQVRPATFLPGERVTCPWPGWGWWPCTVISYSATSRTVKVTDNWGSNKSFGIAEVRIDPPKVRRANSRTRVVLTVLAIGATTGGFLGALTTWLLMR
ncbi:MAG: hypothetical protein KIS66_07750 [Fimbriimonadaceae bacterium]|nr:hypothetical protein [Fimbriimonadaceae bacterium]